MRSVEERFFAKVQPTETCWFWKAEIIWNGYGRMRVGLKRVLAHRLSYEIHKGPIPDGLVVDHLCRTRNCVNPDHLRAVTQQQNFACGVNTVAQAARARTHCVSGHPLSGENLKITPKGRRRCRECSRLGCAKQRARRKLKK